MKYIPLILIVFALSVGTAAAAEFDLPPGDPITFDSIAGVIDRIYIFLVDMSVIVAVGTLIVAGVMWVTAGDSARVEKAKNLLKGGLIGSAIILGAGVIINTVDGFVRSLGDNNQYNLRKIPNVNLGYAKKSVRVPIASNLRYN